MIQIDSALQTPEPTVIVKLEVFMKKYLLVLGMLFCVLTLTFPPIARAVGLEAALGVWYQSPAGNLAFDPLSGSDYLDLENDLGYAEETQPSGRVKIDMPLMIPNIYLMATPMEFEGTGIKGVNFKFGDFVFNANEPVSSKISLDQLDVCLYYSIPFLQTATLSMLNVEIGIDVRILDFSASIDQPTAGISESETFTLPVPMVYLGAQLRPLDKLALEAEGRGITYSGEYVYSLIGRVRLNVIGPFFLTGGYRYEKIKIDQDGVSVDADFSGPFAEVGFSF